MTKAQKAAFDRCKARIDDLTKLRTDDPWVDKFYVALNALWLTIHDQEMPAQGTAPHVVMAKLIEDILWITRKEH